MTTGQAHVRAELGVDDLDPTSGRSKGGRCHLKSRGAEQALALGVRDGASDHDPRGIERVDEPDAGHGEGAPAAP